MDTMHKRWIKMLPMMVIQVKLKRDEIFFRNFINKKRTKRTMSSSDELFHIELLLKNIITYAFEYSIVLMHADGP